MQKPIVMEAEDGVYYVYSWEEWLTHFTRPLDIYSDTWGDFYCVGGN